LLAKAVKKAINQRFFSKESSVFKQWKEETATQRKESIATDCQLWKLNRLMNKSKDDPEIERCRVLIMKHQEFLKEVFINLIAESAYPAISLNTMTSFVQKCNINDSNFSITQSDRCFIGTNFASPENPKFQIIGNALVRFEFWEFFVRAADMKYRQTGLCSTYSEALQKLLEVHILPNASPQPWQSFREKHLWTIECNDILEANLKSLQKIFEKYHTSVKKFVALEDLSDMLIKQANLDVTES
jgi:hypothetical protein